MSDLVKFLRARLDESEAVAVAAIGQDWHVSVTPIDVPGIPGHQAVGIETMPDWEIIECNQGSLAERQAVAEHIARHSPARVVEDIEAKRAIISECEEALTADQNRMQGYEIHQNDGAREIARTVLVTLAGLFWAHPDYDPTWAVR